MATLDSIKAEALKINDTLNTMATAEGKATQSFDAQGNATLTPSSGVPISAMESSAPALQMPEFQLPQADIGGTRSAGQRIIDQEIARTEQAKAQAEAPITQSERQIREMFGILGTESQARNQMEEQAGVGRFSQDLNKFQESLRNQIAQLDAFDLNNIQQNELARVDASRRDITKRTFGAMTAEENIKNAVARAQIVAEARTTIASIEATRGNLQAATEQVDKALKAIYEPIRMGMQMEMFFLERNDKRFDAAQKELANARMMGIQRELKTIDDAEALVQAVVASGGATPDQIQKLATMTDPYEQRNMAMGLLSQVNASDRALDRAYKNMQIENIQDQIRDRNAKTTEGKPLTQSQYTALGYAERTIEAGAVIDELGGKFTGALAGIGAKAPNALKSEERQMYEQAQRNFINAVLRRESGAAIAESEFESAALQYFPQPGDSVSVVIQKRQNRETVQRNLLREGGQDTTPQDRNINDPLGLGLNFNSSVQDPLGIGGFNTSTKAF
jgi:hypothetical protein